MGVAELEGDRLAGHVRRIGVANVGGHGRVVVLGTDGRRAETAAVVRGADVGALFKVVHFPRWLLELQTLLGQG